MWSVLLALFQQPSPIYRSCVLVPELFQQQFKHFTDIYIIHQCLFQALFFECHLVGNPWPWDYHSYLLTWPQGSVPCHGHRLRRLRAGASAGLPATGASESRGSHGGPGASEATAENTSGTKTTEATEATQAEAEAEAGDWVGWWGPSHWDLLLVWRGVLWKTPNFEIPKYQRWCDFCGAKSSSTTSRTSSSASHDHPPVAAGPEFVTAGTVPQGVETVAAQGTQATAALELCDVTQGTVVASGSSSSSGCCRSRAATGKTRSCEVWWRSRGTTAPGALFPGLCGTASEQLSSSWSLLCVHGTLCSGWAAVWVCGRDVRFTTRASKVATLAMFGRRGASNGTRWMGGSLSVGDQWWAAEVDGHPEHSEVEPCQTSQVVVLPSCHSARLATLGSASKWSCATCPWPSLHGTIAEFGVPTSAGSSASSTTKAVSELWHCNICNGPTAPSHWHHWAKFGCTTCTSDGHLSKTRHLFSSRPTRKAASVAASECPGRPCAGILRCGTCDDPDETLEFRGAMHYLPRKLVERGWSSTIAVLPHLSSLLHWSLVALEGGVSAGQTFSPTALIPAQGCRCHRSYDLLSRFQRFQNLSPWGKIACIFIIFCHVHSPQSYSGWNKSFERSPCLFNLLHRSSLLVCPRKMGESGECVFSNILWVCTYKLCSNILGFFFYNLYT